MHPSQLSLTAEPGCMSAGSNCGFRLPVLTQPGSHETIITGTGPVLPPLAIGLALCRPQIPRGWITRYAGPRNLPFTLMFFQKHSGLTDFTKAGSRQATTSVHGWNPTRLHDRDTPCTEAQLP